MARSEAPTLVFVHGVGGSSPQETWLTPLSDVMAQQGHSRPEQSGLHVVTTDYRSALLDPDHLKIPPSTWRKPDDIADHFAAYQVRRAEQNRIIRQFEQVAPKPGLGRFDENNAHAIARLVESTLQILRKEARRYRTDEEARASVLTRVRDDLRDHRRLVIIAHSLGSIVTADLIKRLPANTTVEQLITVGSPLPLTRLWRFLDLAGDGFPFDRVKSWVNVFDSLDPVSSGRGIGIHFPEATDAGVHFGSLARLASNHASEYYLSLPVVGALVGQALHGEPATGHAARHAPVRAIGADWSLHLLGAAYALQVSSTCDGKKHAWRRRFDAARRASVLKLLSDVDEHKHSLPVSAIEVPTQADFLDHATGLVRRGWSDEELLPFAVAMLMSSPVRPYEVDITPEHAEKAITSLFDRIRREGSSLSDPVFGEAVADALREARKVMGGDSRFWAYLMLGGAFILTLTGVGIWAAAPAGLAGAALITSTLAAFGPGGMVGGMMTIAAASGAGSALLGAGASRASQDQNVASVSFATSIANLPKEQLHATVTGWIARIIAEQKLSFSSSVQQTRALLLAALIRVTNEENSHRGLKSAGARAWDERRKILERAISWLDKNFPSAAAQGVLKALERGEGPLVIEASQVQSPAPVAQTEPSAPSELGSATKD